MIWWRSRLLLVSTEMRSLSLLQPAMCVTCACDLRADQSDLLSQPGDHNLGTARCVSDVASRLGTRGGNKSADNGEKNAIV